MVLHISRYIIPKPIAPNTYIVIHNEEKLDIYHNSNVNSVSRKYHANMLRP